MNPPNKKEGIERVYYESGEVLFEIPFKDNKAEGVFKGYYKNKTLQSEGSVKKGKKDGIEKTYRDDGSLQLTVNNSEGYAISGICHHTNKSTSVLTDIELKNWDKEIPPTCD